MAGALIVRQRLPDHVPQRREGAAGPRRDPGSGAADARGALGGSGSAEHQAHLYLLLEPTDEAVGEREDVRDPSSWVEDTCDEPVASLGSVFPAGMVRGWWGEPSPAL